MTAVSWDAGWNLPTRFNLNVRLAPRYRARMLWLLPLTAGAGTFWLWVRTLRWPEQIGRDGIRLRNGRTLRWHDVRRLAVVKDQFFEDEEGVIRLEIETSGPVISLKMQDFENGQVLARAIRNGFTESRRTPASAGLVTPSP